MRAIDRHLSGQAGTATMSRPSPDALFHATPGYAGPEGWSDWMPHDFNSFLIAIGIVVASFVMIRLLRGTRAQ
jgi:hypothetical protein